jgi:hypothetical protein
VFLNQAKFMFGQNTFNENFQAVTDTNQFEARKRWDATNQPDSLALTNASKNKYVYWLDLGLNEFNEPAEERLKFQVLSVDSRAYRFKLQNINSSTSETFEILKDTSYNRVYFSFKTKKVVAVEPPKNAWDIQFTKYVHTFYDPYIPYLVVGALLNPHQTEASADSSRKFSEIDRTFAQNQNLSPTADVIGYSWKAFGINGSLFTVFPQKNYIVKTQNGYFYKLHFIDFYDDRGRKGNPKFEFQRL